MRTALLALVTLALFLMASAVSAQVAGAAPTVSTTSGAGLTSIKLYYSKNAPASYNNQYVGVKVVNDSTARTDLWVKVTDVSGGNVTLATGETGERHVGAIAASASTHVYFLFKANSATLTDTTFNIKLYNGPPNAGGTQIGTSTAAAFTEVSESQNASANKVTGGYVSPTNPALGSEFTVVLTGLTGQMSNASGTAIFTPAFAQGWDPSAFELVKTELQFDFNASGNRNFVNQLYFPVANNGSTSGELDNNGGAYTATYTFRAVNKTNASVKPTPVGHIKSGSIWKYTNASSLSSIAPIEPVTNSFTIAAAASPTQSADGYITYILTLANTSTKTLSVDLVKDVLPAGTTYQAGTSKYQGATIANPNNSSGNLTWSGPFTVAGGARATLTYQVKADSVTATPTSYANSATAQVGATVIDTTLDTTDSAPATATASVSTTYTADTTAPTITLSAVDGANAALANAGSTSSTGATMTFSADETSTFTCSIDGAAPTSCASPRAYSGLSAGSHTFWVYATDAAGNIGSRSLQWTVVNNAKPEVASFQPKVVASNASPLTYTLEFTKDITPSSLTTSDLSLVTTGSPGTWTISSVLGSGTTYLVTITSASPGTSGTVALKLAANGVTDGSQTGPTSDATSGAITMTNTLGLAITSASPASGATSNTTSATFSFGPTAGRYPPDQYMCKGPGEAAYTECTSPVTYTGLSAGSNTFYVYGNALDASGNVASTTSSSPESSSWTIDLTAPTVTLTSPSAGATLTDNTPTLAGACTTGDGNVSIPLYSGAAASGTPVQTASASCSGGAWTVDASTLTDGQYTAKAEQTDAGGNTGYSGTRTFTIDATVPTVTVTPNTASTSTGSADFTITFSESVTGLTSGDLAIGGTSTSPAWSVNTLTGSAASYSVNLTTASTPTQGTVTLKVTANAVSDAAGNAGPASDSAVASMDVVAIGDLVNGAVTANNGNAWGASRSLGVSKTDFVVSGGGSATNTLYRRVASWSGGACGTFDAGTQIDINTTSDDTSALGDKCFKYELRGNGNSKNATVESNLVQVDLTAPVLGDITLAGGDNQLTNSASPAIAKGTKSDAASGLKAADEKLTRASTTFTGNACGTFAAYDAASEIDILLSATADSGLASGCYRYTHRVGDNAGNQTTKQSTVKVDVDDPASGTMSVNGGDPWTNSQKPALGGTAFSDVNSGIAAGAASIKREKATLSGASCDNDWAVDQASVDDSGGAENDTLVQSCYRYTRLATDRAGNPASAGPVTVKIDRTNPSGGSVSAAGGSEWTKVAKPALAGSSYTDANSGVATSGLTRASATLSGSTCGTFGSETTVTVTAGADADALTQNCYRYTRSATDNAGNATSTTTTVKIDQTDPTGGAVTANGGNATWTKDAKPALSRSAFADANSGVDNATDAFTRGFAAFNADGNCTGVSYAGSTVVTIDGNGRDADAGTLGEGCYRYRSSASDNAGNAATNDATVFIDRTNPSGGSVSAAGGSEWTKVAKPALAGSSYTDANSGVATSGLTRASATLSGSTCGTFGSETTVTVTAGADADALTQNCYRYTRSATDNAGNATSTTTTVKIDQTDPTGGSVTVAGGSAWTRSQNPAVGGSTFSDANSGVASATLTRQRADLTGSTCGTFGSATSVTLSGGNESATLDQACYRYTRGATDNAGNAATAAEVVKVDRTDPTGGAVTASGGNARWTKDAKPTLSRSAFADANSGLDNATDSFTRGFAAFNADGNCTGVSYAGSTAVTIDGNGRDAEVGALGEGCYRYRSSASDNVGNAATNDATVFIDRTAPAGGALSAAKTSGPWANTPKPGLSGTAFTDANSGIDASTSVTRIARERAPYVAGTNTCSGTWTVDDANVTISGGEDTDTLSEACYRYSREAGDNAGNTASTTPDTVKLDLTGPSGGAVTANGGTDIDIEAGNSPEFDVNDFADQLSGLRAGSETLTRRIAPWVGSVASVQTRSGRMATRSEFGDYGSAQPVTLVGTEDPVAVDPGRYFYEHTVIDVSGNVSTTTALVEIRPRGWVPPATPADTPSGSGGGVAPGTSGSSQGASEAPRLTASIAVTTRRVRSGRVLPATIVITNTGGATGPVVVSLRLRAGMAIAEVPRGGRLADGRLLLPLDGLAAGTSHQVKVFLRLSSTRTRTMLVRGAVHRAGAADVAAISPKITVLAQSRRNGLTG